MSGARMRLRGENGDGGIIPGTPVPGGGAGDIIPREYFGFHSGSLLPKPPGTIWGDYSASAANAYTQQVWPTHLKTGAIRLWDANGCSWRNIERAKGVFHWERLDAHLALAASNDHQVIYTLGCGPDWATAPNYGQQYHKQPSKPTGWHVGYNPHPPVNDADWTDWCAAVADRLVAKGHVGAAYEIWNECNDDAFGADHVGSGYAGTVERLVELTALARDAILAVDPTATIVGANFTGIEGITGPIGAVTLSTYVAAGGMDYADVVSIHGYNSAAPWMRPEGLLNFANLVRGVLVAANVIKPIWNTEWGWGSWTSGRAGGKPFRSSTIPNSESAPGTDPMPDQQSADYLSRMLIVNWCVGWRRLAYYGTDAFHWASQLLYDPADKSQAKVGALAGGYFQDLLVGGQLSNLVKLVAGGVPYYRASFTTASGRIGHVFWCDEFDAATRPQSIPITGALEVRSNLGVALDEGEALALTGSPKFVFYS